MLTLAPSEHIPISWSDQLMFGFKFQNDSSMVVIKPSAFVSLGSSKEIIENVEIPYCAVFIKKSSFSSSVFAELDPSFITL